MDVMEAIKSRRSVRSYSDRHVEEEKLLRVLEAGPARPESLPSRLPFAGMRQAIAEQMVHSLSTMAQVSMSTRADVTELKATREALGARWGRKPSYTDFLVKAVAVALQEHPLLGARLEGDEIAMPTELNVGVAVALEDAFLARGCAAGVLTLAGSPHPVRG